MTYNITTDGFIYASHNRFGQDFEHVRNLNPAKRSDHGPTDPADFWRFIGPVSSPEFAIKPAFGEVHEDIAGGAPAGGRLEGPEREAQPGKVLLFNINSASSGAFFIGFRTATDEAWQGQIGPFPVPAGDLVAVAHAVGEDWKGYRAVFLTGHACSRVGVTSQMRKAERVGLARSA